MNSKWINDWEPLPYRYTSTQFERNRRWYPARSKNQIEIVESSLPVKVVRKQGDYNGDKGEKNT